MTTLRLATISDLDALLSFYDYTIDHTPGIESYAQWHRGKHPTSQLVEGYIREGSMYLCQHNGIAAAMALTPYQDPTYHAIQWRRPLPDDQVAAIHIFAVNPDLQGAGLGATLVRQAISIARQKGKKALRLDATSTNTPVHRFYQRLGFQQRGRQTLDTGPNGRLTFLYFELDLD